MIYIWRQSLPLVWYILMILLRHKWSALTSLSNLILSSNWMWSVVWAFNPVILAVEHLILKATWRNWCMTSQYIIDIRFIHWTLKSTSDFSSKTNTLSRIIINFEFLWINRPHLFYGWISTLKLSTILVYQQVILKQYLFILLKFVL